MNNKLSIIIATFNAEKTLATALESVVHQNFSNWECIIIDGASKDNTLSIIKKYQSIDSRIRFISEPDKGIYDAFNKGWKMANGQWIYYLGSDDRLTPNGIADLMQNTNGADIVAGNIFSVKITGEIKKQFAGSFEGCHQAKITSKKALEDANGFNLQYKILADKDLMIRLQKKGYKLKTINTEICYFNMGGISQKLSSQYTMFRERYSIYKTNQCRKYPLLASLNATLHYINSIIYRKIKQKFQLK